MERILTTREATIQAVQVEIKALKVGKKQVTMGLFRQLPRAALLDPETVQLNGVPWGYVNYWWDGDGRLDWRDDDRLHVVWQRGDELRRGIVYQGADPGFLSDYRGQIEQGINLWFLANVWAGQLFAYTPPGQHQEKRTVTMNEHAFTVRFAAMTWYAIDAYVAWRHRNPQQEAEDYGKRPYVAAATAAAYAQRLAEYHRALVSQQQEAEDQYRQLLLDNHILNIAPGDLVKNVQQLQDEERDYRERWDKQWQTLCQLPQLYIAI